MLSTTEPMHLASERFAELVKAVSKALLVAGAAVWVAWSVRDEIFALFGQSLEVGLAGAGHLISYSFLLIVMAMLLIWRHRENIQRLMAGKESKLGQKKTDASKPAPGAAKNASNGKRR